MIFAATLLLLMGIAAFAANRQGWFSRSVPMPDAAQEFRLLMERFSKTQNTFSIAGTVNLFDGASGTTIRETMEFMTYRNSHSFYSSIGSRFTLCDGQWLLSWDTLSHEMFLDQAPDLRLLSQPFALPFNDTSALSVSGEVVENSKDERVLALRSDVAPEIKICYVHYNPVNYTIRSADIHWRDNNVLADTGKIWVTKVLYRPLDPGSINIPVVKEMVSIGKDPVVPLGAYREYRLQTNNPFKEP